MFALTLHAYCGMAIPIEDGDRADVRQAAAQQIRMCRAERRQVNIIQRGRQWELEEPDNATMIPDDAGILSLSDCRAECSECGDKLDDTDLRQMSASARRYVRCNDCANADHRFEYED